MIGLGHDLGSCFGAAGAVGAFLTFKNALGLQAAGCDHGVTELRTEAAA